MFLKNSVMVILVILYFLVPEISRLYPETWYSPFLAWAGLVLATAGLYTLSRSSHDIQH